MTILPKNLALVEQKRKYKEPNEEVFEEFILHLDKLKSEFVERYEIDEDIKYDINNFQIINILNKGSFGTTVLGIHDVLGKYFVAKVIPKKLIINDNKLTEIKSQKDISQAIRFPFLLHMEFCFKDQKNVFFVYPYLSREDLCTYLYRVKTIKERDAIFYGAQILLAIEYLHYLNIMHRNIKPENIIFNYNGYIKLSDFRFIKRGAMRTYTFCGTNEYFPPEIILFKGYGKSIDWWSFGILLYEMIAGITPFYASDPIHICEKILYKKVKFNNNFSENARNLIKNILQRDISMRYGNLKNGSLDIKCHVWFEIIDWQALYNEEINAPYLPEYNINVEGEMIDTNFGKGYTEYEKEFKDF